MPDPFHIFSLLPPEARLFATIGDGRMYISLNQINCREYLHGVPMNAVKSAMEDAAVLLAVANRNFSKEFHGRAELYTRDEQPRIEFTGDLEGLTLYLHTDHILHSEWKFIGMSYDQGTGIYPPEGVTRFKKVAALIASLPFETE